MARTVASLSVSINARTKGLRRGLKKARAQIGDFANAVTGAIGRVAKLGAGLGLLAAGVTAIGTGRAISSLDNLAKTARKLSIKPTALVALRDAAKESGVEVKTFDMGLQRMLRRVQEAAKGKGEALPTIKELGLDASRLARMKPEEQFMAVAKAMDRMKDDGQDLARAMKLFDSEGVALVNTLRLVNEKGLKPFIEAATRTGRAGPLIEERLPNIERITDALTRLRDRITGIFDQIAVGVSVPLDQLLQRFERFLNSPAVRKKMIQFFLDLRAAGINAEKWLIDFFKNRGAAGEFREELNRLFDRFKEFLSWVTSHLDAQTIRDFFVTIVENASKAVDAVQSLIDTYKELKSLIPGVFKEAISQTSDRMLQLDNAIRDPMSILKGAHKAIAGAAFSGNRSVDVGGAVAANDEERKQTKILEEIKMQGSMRRGASGQLVLVAG